MIKLSFALLMGQSLFIFAIAIEATCVVWRPISHCSRLRIETRKPGEFITA